MNRVVHYTLMGMLCSSLTQNNFCMQEILLDKTTPQASVVSCKTRPYTLADVAIAIAYTSDQQEGNAEQAAKKEGFDAITPALFAQWPNIQAKAELRAGDLIEGNESAGITRAFFGSSCTCACCCCNTCNEPEAQAERVIGQIEECEKKTGVPVYATVGNHDFYDRSYSIPRWIVQRHGDLRYMAPITRTNGSQLPVRIICCGAYTDDKTCTWLEQQFINIQAETGHALPVIVLTHIDEQKGNNKNWIRDEEIAHFAKTLARYDNIQEIATGHSHSSYVLDWSPQEAKGKHYFTNCAGGDKKIVSLYDTHGNRLDTLFFKAHKNTDGSYSPEQVAPIIEVPTPSSAWDDAIQCWWNHHMVNQWYTE